MILASKRERLVAHPEPSHDVGQDLQVSVEQPAGDTGDHPAAVAHHEPAHNVGQDIGVSVETAC